MTLFFLPTNVSLPTRLDDARRDYIVGGTDLEAFERLVEQLLADGTADDVSPDYGMPLAGEWR